MKIELPYDFILETGRLSPSSFGFEPWKFVILQNKRIRERLLPVTWGALRTLPTASHFVLLLSRTVKGMHPDAEHIRYMMEEIQKLPANVVEGKGSFYGTFMESDFRLLEDDRLVFEWGCRQTYIALGNMMTAPAQIGVDSCPIEGFVKDKAEDILAEEGILDKDQFGLACMAAFGYRVQEPRGKTRRPMEAVAEWIL